MNPDGVEPTLEPTVEPTFEPTIEPTFEPTPELTPSPTSEPTPEPTDTTTPALYWEVVIVISPEQIAALESSQYNSFANLTASGVQYEILDDRIKFSGSESIDQLRKAVFEDISPVVDFLGGPIELNVSMPVESNQELDINLETRLSAGYSWKFSQSTEDVQFIQSTEATFFQRGEGYQSSSIETIKFHAIGVGIGNLQLKYRQPFDPNSNLHAALNITFSNVVNSLDLTNPNPLITNPAEELSSNSTDTEQIQVLPQDVSLPSSYDWRNFGVIPDIRNQGSCGSCWAFSTVGVMESAIRIAGGPLEDLSEQFLVSCNKNGWNCDYGGYAAHKYHYNTLGYNQTEIGAVLETSFPYSGTNGSCSISYTHPYKLSSYSFVSGSEFTIPSVAAIKSAIFQYGPVSTRICAGDSFGDYTGGVFSTEESATDCNGGINHYVVLTGWDDSTQTWNLRNSWGTWWGESGYMRIRWGTSRVGEGTSWVRYNVGTPIPLAPTLTSPSNAIVTDDPNVVFQWSSVANGNTYQIQVDDLNTFASPLIDNTGTAGQLSFTVNPLPAGIWYWHVRAINTFGQYGAWSLPRAVTIDTTAPLPPVLSLPANAAISRGTPTFSWLAAATANAYQFAYDNEANCPSPLYTSAVQATLTHLPPAMELGTYNWCAQSRDPAGNWSGWSASRTVIIRQPIPIAPVLTLPANALVTLDTTPDFGWNAVPYGSTYEIQIDNLATFAVPIEQEATGLGLTYTATPLTDGLKYWRVRAVNVHGEPGAWSLPRAVTIDTTAPLPPVLSLPANAAIFGEHRHSRGWQLSPPMPTSSPMTTKPTVLPRCIPPQFRRL